MTPAAMMVIQAKNNAWANEVLGAACIDLGAAGFTAPRPGFFGSLKATLNHIRLIDYYYFDAVAAGGRGRSVFDEPEIDDPTAHAAAQADMDQQLIAFCEGLDASALNATITTERARGPVGERMDMTLLHLFQHQIHHRGQAHAMLSHAGAAPPQLDDFYLEHGRVPSAQRYWDA